MTKIDWNILTELKADTNPATFAHDIEIYVDLTLKSISENSIQAKKLIYIDIINRILTESFSFNVIYKFFLHKDEVSIQKAFEEVPSKEKYLYPDVEAFTKHIEKLFLLDLDHFELILPEIAYAEGETFHTSKVVEQDSNKLLFNIDNIKIEQQVDREPVVSRIMIAMNDFINVPDLLKLDLIFAQDYTTKFEQFFAKVGKIPTKIESSSEYNENELHLKEEIAKMSNQFANEQYNVPILLQKLLDLVNLVDRNIESFRKPQLLTFIRFIQNCTSKYGIDIRKQSTTALSAAAFTISFTRLEESKKKIKNSIRDLESNLQIDVSQPPVGNVINYLPVQSIDLAVKDITKELNFISEEIMPRQGFMVEELDSDTYGFVIDSTSNLIEKVQNRHEKIRREEELRQQKKQEDLDRFNNLPPTVKDGIPIHPSDYFRMLTDYFSAWDETGLPLMDANGEELTTEMRIELSKKYSKMHLEHNLYSKSHGEAAKSAPVEEYYEYNEA
ncbi:hypothetical protein TVAG_489000 [Trichomonas vaginalis G3]|uniref:Uncharacterized protein n=1 Tax=Trichomonas vaginalis (strain ATCC PRA-98 / G3) TaxID=412133 RepID=A2FL72_TRIV3|nr:cysteinyl-tRNA synthetase family [Trichomonas vaginalis G3]EAX94361.1 hypothetical protein TVAG_489000 [Trichomonas vaginalis G3]KAI5536476.1 cysteinyl-tRNA synthetase family [Trichomonas vaginalis G3]|eukprot:XP_001307291.1 hypothetical protein [Trichomonas vaginalis G3]